MREVHIEIGILLVCALILADTAIDCLTAAPPLRFGGWYAALALIAFGVAALLAVTEGRDDA